MTELEIAGRLAVVALCSGLIGLEREATHKAAGLRTHMLIGVGAALFTIVSITGFEGSDSSRVAAQVVTGVGFLGAGAIFHEGVTVRGLTTAAGMWVAAALGLAAGSGQIGLTLTGTAIALIVMTGMRIAERRIKGRSTS